MSRTIYFAMLFLLAMAIMTHADEIIDENPDDTPVIDEPEGRSNEFIKRYGGCHDGFVQWTAIPIAWTILIIVLAVAVFTLVWYTDLWFGSSKGQMDKLFENKLREIRMEKALALYEDYQAKQEQRKAHKYNYQYTTDRETIKAPLLTKESNKYYSINDDYEDMDTREASNVY